MKHRLWIALSLLPLLLSARLSPYHGLGHGSGSTGSTGTALALVRNFTNTTGSTSPATAFWMVGQPFVSCPSCGTAPTPDVPPGNTVTATLGSNAARIGLCERKFDASGDLAWAQVMVDASSAGIASGGNANLTFSSVAGAFGSTTVGVTAVSSGAFTISSAVLEAGFAQRPIIFTGGLNGLAGFVLNQLYYAYYTSSTTFTLYTEAGVQIVPTGTYAGSGLSIVLDTSIRTDADWEGVADTIIASNVSTFSTGGNDMNVGPYTATFDGGATNTITVLCTSPVGREVQVAATFVNSGTSATHCYLKAMIDYWVTQKSDGSLGPIASLPWVENMQEFKGTGNGCSGATGEFTADLAWYRNGTLMRNFTSVPMPAGSAAMMVRADGQWDWSANDPGFVVTQDYTKVDATYKTPPYIHGVSYNGSGYGNLNSGSISAVNTSTGLFTSTLDLNAIVLNPANGVTGAGGLTNAIQFIGSGGSLTGLSVCANIGACPAATIYWVCKQNSGASTFFIYDNEIDAFNCTSTGQIIPGGSYSGSGLSAVLANAPESVAMYQAPIESGPGFRPDLAALFSEWGVAYLMGSNTYNSGQAQLWQLQGRTQAYALAVQPTFVVNTDTNRMVSFIDGAHTPTALSTARPTSWVGPVCNSWSSDINGGTGPTGNTKTSGGGAGQMHPDGKCGYWIQSNPDHAPGNTGYVVWLLEGNPVLQRFGTIWGNEGEEIWQISNEKNFHNTVVSSTTFYGIAGAANNAVIRANAWMERDIGEARFMAIDGSAEEQVLTTYLNNEGNFLAAYNAYKGTNYTNLGLVSPDDTSGGIITSTFGTAPYGSTFMNGYVTWAFGFSAQIDGDFATAFKTQADNIVGYQEKTLENDNNFCSWYADTYNPIWSYSGLSTSTPGSYIASINPLAAGFELTYTFAQNGTITAIDELTGGNPVSGWNESGGVSSPFLAGDTFRPFNSMSDGVQYANPPASLTIGNDYSIINPSGATFQLDNGSGSPITFAAGTGVQQTVTNATWTSNYVAITVAQPTGFTAAIYPGGAKVIMAGMSPTSLNGFFQAIVLWSNTAAAWSSGQITFTTTTPTAIAPGDTFTTTGFANSGYNGTWTALAGSGGTTILVTKATNPGTTTNGTLNSPTNEFTYFVSGSGTPTFSSATEAPLDGGVMSPVGHTGSNCPSIANGFIHSGATGIAGSYADEVVGGVCLQASRQGSAASATWGTACSNGVTRLGTPSYNGDPAWSARSSP